MNHRPLPLSWKTLGLLAVAVLLVLDMLIPEPLLRIQVEIQVPEFWANLIGW